MKSTLHIGALALLPLLLLLPGKSVSPWEKYTTTAELISKAPYVAHVRVEDYQIVSRQARLYDFRLTVLENLKGRLPTSIRVRILAASRVIDPDGLPDAPGTEWVVILGKPLKSGIYPLLSLNWGKIEILENRATGEKVLGRPLTGMKEKKGRRYISLDDFRTHVRGQRGRGR